MQPHYLDGHGRRWFGSERHGVVDDGRRGCAVCLGQGARHGKGRRQPIGRFFEELPFERGQYFRRSSTTLRWGEVTREPILEIDAYTSPGALESCAEPQPCFRVGDREVGGMRKRVCGKTCCSDAPHVAEDSARELKPFLRATVTEPGQPPRLSRHAVTTGEIRNGLPRPIASGGERRVASGVDRIVSDAVNSDDMARGGEGVRFLLRARRCAEVACDVNSDFRHSVREQSGLEESLAPGDRCGEEIVQPVVKKRNSLARATRFPKAVQTDEDDQTVLRENLVSAAQSGSSVPLDINLNEMQSATAVVPTQIVESCGAQGNRLRVAGIIAAI